MAADRIVYCDLAWLHYASFYLNGFSVSARKLGYRFRIRRTLPPALAEALLDPAWMGIRFAMSVYQATVGGRTFTFCIDAHDSNRLDSTNKQYGYHLPLLKSVDVYFKVNYQPDEIRAEPALAEHAEKIRPIAPFFPVAPNLSLRHRLRLLPSRRSAVSFDDCRRNLRTLRCGVTERSVRESARRPKDLDLFFVTSYRRPERHQSATEGRLQLLERLQATSPGPHLLGFADAGVLPAAAEPLRLPRLGYSDYVRQLARARVVIYARGLHNCLSSKLSLALGVGAAIVGQPLVNRQEWLDRYPHLQTQLAYEDPEPTVARAAELLGKPREIQDLSAANREFFERELVPSRAAEQVLRELRGG